MLQDGHQQLTDEAPRIKLIRPEGDAVPEPWGGHYEKALAGLRNITVDIVESTSMVSKGGEKIGTSFEAHEYRKILYGETERGRTTAIGEEGFSTGKMVSKATQHDVDGNVIKGNNVGDYIKNYFTGRMQKKEDNE